MFPAQNAMGGSHLHTPQSIFQHMMGQQNSLQQPGPWMQMPQVPPLSIPWSMPSLQQPELVTFTGGPSLDLILHKKRKHEASDLLDKRQTKQFITEEKMAAHFQELHISSNYEPQTPVASTSAGAAGPAKEFKMELDLDAANAVDADQERAARPKLVLSEEIKRLQQEPILPSALLSKLERPSMALVLWEPPNKHLRILPSRDTPTPAPGASEENDNNNNNNNAGSSSSNNNNNNNNESMPDLNQMSSSSGDFEPMES